MNLNIQKTSKERKKRYIDKLDSFELAFKRFIELPPEKMIISHFRDKQVCREVLGYDGCFCDDFQIYREIRNYYQKSIVTKKIQYLLPCDEIYNRLIYMGFATFDLYAMQGELQSKRYKLKVEKGVKNARNSKVKDENREIKVHITGEPFDIAKFLKAYKIYESQIAVHEEYKKNKGEALTEEERKDIRSDYSRINSDVIYAVSYYTLYGLLHRNFKLKGYQYAIIFGIVGFSIVASIVYLFAHVSRIH